MTRSPVRHQTSRLVAGAFYVCEIHGPQVRLISPLCDRRLVGPFDTQGEALAAQGAFEAEHPQFQARTEVWQSSLAETLLYPIAVPTPHPEPQAPLTL